MPDPNPDILPEAARSRRAWPTVLLVFLCIVVGFAAGAGFLGYRTLETLTRHLPKGFFVPEQVRVTESLVLNRIRDVAKIVTVEYHMADAIDYRNDRMWPFQDNRALVIARAKVLAGFDLTDGNMEIAIRETGDSKTTEKPVPFIRITLPPPEIISVDPTIQYHDLQGALPMDIHNWMLLRARNQLKQAAIQAGILARAEQSIRVQVAGMFPGANITIDFYASKNGLETGNE